MIIYYTIITLVVIISSSVVLVYNYNNNHVFVELPKEDLNCGHVNINSYYVNMDLEDQKYLLDLCNNINQRASK